MEGSTVHLDVDRGAGGALELRSLLGAGLVEGAPPDVLVEVLGRSIGLEAELVSPAEAEPGDLPLELGGELLAHLRLSGRGDELEPLLECASGVIALALAQERRLAITLAEDPPALLAHVLSLARERPASARRLGSFAGVDLEHPAAVACAPVSGARQALALRSVAARSLVCDEGSTVVVVAPSRQPLPLARAIARALAAAGDGATVGIAHGAVAVEGLAEAIDQARRAASAAALLGYEGEVATLADLGMRGVLATADPALHRGAEQLLAPLIEYDASHHRDLVQTLDVFLQEQGKATATARRLYLHLNTLYYRLQRIEELAGLDLDDMDTRFRLELALRLVTPAALSADGSGDGR
ncbi:MAG TPA: helix-turn-helix domain-containing protein [Solirubrobacterales bacterium]|jgi:hypothetical protein